jgi:hypothetical protein
MTGPVYDFSRVLAAKARQLERQNAEPVHGESDEFPEAEHVAILLAEMYEHLASLDAETAGQLQAAIRRNLPEPVAPHHLFPWMEIAWVQEITSAPGVLQSWYDDRFHDTYGHDWKLPPGSERVRVDRSSWPIEAPPFGRWRLAIYGW